MLPYVKCKCEVAHCRYIIIICMYLVFVECKRKGILYPRLCDSLGTFLDCKSSGDQVTT